MTTKICFKVNNHFLRSKRKYDFLILFVCFYLGILNSVFAQIDTKVDTTHIKIGEPIQFELSVPIHPKDKIQLPDLKDTLTYHIEILEQKIDTLYTGENKKLVQRLTLTSFDPGDFLIRSLPVVVNKDTFLSHAFQIKVDEVKIDSSNLAGFPIKPIMEETYTFKDYWDKYWLYFAVAALVFFALLIVAILFLRDRKRKEGKSIIVKTPYEEAKDALKGLDKKKYLEKGQIYPYYSDLSFLLRRYVGRIFNFSSMELLSDDMISYFRKTTHLDKEDIEKLKGFLFDSDLVKYAKAIPQEDRHEFYRKWVEELIDKTKPLDLEDESINEIKSNEKFREIK